MLDYPVLFFDGECALCNRSVRFIMKHENKDVLQFASLQSDFAKQHLINHFGANPLPNSLILLEKNTISLRSKAVFRIISYLKPSWKLVFVFKIFPTTCLDFVYDFVARNRKRVFGTSISCEFNPNVDQSRFKK
ncbi:MAG: DCC1-like thiol-disulfide oxidoreductase family protein [Ignavibacteria bacterium]|nr:DCC1-like thiol-disulfide oxidoreductase family protein [Ignavibacteria bacterium]